MRTRIGWLAWLLAAGAALVSTTAQAQNGQYEVPPAPFVDTVPWALGHPRLEDGGFFTIGEFLYWMQSNPLKPQLIAFRGLLDQDGSISQALGLNDDAIPGFFIGSRTPALDVDWVTGPLSYTPGFNFGAGWRFRSGLTLSANWIHIAERRYSATASNQPGTSQGLFLAETFITSPVFNYPIDYSGPGNQVGIGNVGATAGIWNASILQTIDFLQRFDQFNLTVRYPLQQTDCWRSYGLFGPRITWFWERFKWRVADADVNGFTFADDVAEYTNVVSQRLYGVHLGMGNDWLLGSTPIGAFSISLDLEGSIALNFVKGRAKYEIGDKHTAASRNRNFYSMVPAVEGNLNLWW
ncbi:MAG: hypothetical protein L0Z62_24925, partial [Gemmataceae bacterium]|nr:hypothetical protein [Gemmataceae bacterium]